jgi:hypothetical protein
MAMAEQEYQELRAFLKLYTEVLSPCDDRLSPEAMPLACLDRTAAVSRAQAGRGLRMAINDLIEAHRHDPPDQIAAIDAACKSHAVITLSQLRRRYSASYSAILRAGKLRSDTDYYLVQGVLSDGASDTPIAERSKLEQMANDYEAAAVRSAARRQRPR